MKTFAIHSPNDAAILIRLHDDLVKAGFTRDYAWNEDFLQFNKRAGQIGIYEDESFDFYVSRVANAEHHRDLTPSNYDAILSEIIESRS